MFGITFKTLEVWVSILYVNVIILYQFLRSFVELPGIDQQSDVGFITLMEQMRYITVGSFYKNPKNPVWIMGSETHLTGKCTALKIIKINLNVCFLVLFSNEKKLVSPETPCEVAKRVFKSFDPYGNNFIPTTVLQEVLSTLNLVSETE